MELEAYAEAAEAAARRAGAILLEMAGCRSVREKGRGDLVTSADIAAQEAIRNALLGRFPGHTLLGEESAEAPDPVAEFRWIVDPLDGTTNYVHGLEFFAVSIGLEVRGELAVGIIYDPSADRCFRAVRGGGAFLDRRRIAVSGVPDLRGSLLVTGFAADLSGAGRALELFRVLCGETHSVRRLGSAALDLAYVACGRFDGFYAANLHAWDAAAGVLLIREAGGIVSSLDGSPYNLYHPHILATNGRIHDALAGITREFV